MKTKIELSIPFFFGLICAIMAVIGTFLVFLGKGDNLALKIFVGVLIPAAIYGSYYCFSDAHSLKKISDLEKEKKIKNEENKLGKWFSPLNTMSHHPHQWSLNEIKEILSECNEAEDYAYVHSIVTAFVKIPESYKNKEPGHEYTLSDEVLDLVSLELNKAVDSILTNEEMDKKEKWMKIQWVSLFLRPPWRSIEDTEERKALRKKLKDKSKELFPSYMLFRDDGITDLEWEVMVFGHWG